MIFGWDISTSIVGFSALDDDGNFIESRYIDLRKNNGDLTDKGRCVLSAVTKIAGKYGSATSSNDKHFIEDRLGSFAFGKTSQQTLLKLAAFNAVVSWIIWDYYCNVYGGTLKHIHPATIKAEMKKIGLIVPKGSDKKVLTLEWVKLVEPTFPFVLNKNNNIQSYCYDMADSFCIAKTGFILNKK